MSAKHALLGLLVERPGYPYQLGDRLRERLGPTWGGINSGQISATIRRMAQDGLVEPVERPGEGGADRRVVAIAEAGVAEWHRWLEEGDVEPRLSRRSLLVKLTLAGGAHQRETLQWLDAYERTCTSRLEEVERAVSQVPDDGPRPRADRVLLRINLRADIIELEGELRLVRHAREMVSWLLASDAIWPTRADRSAAEERSLARGQLFGRMAAQDRTPGALAPGETGCGSSP